MTEKWVIGCPHWGHKNIIDYENRPFASVEEMNKALIDNWNAKIKDDDIVFVLGDVFFCNQKEAKAIMDQLKGRKFLVKGNHDRAHGKKWFLDIGFEEVSDYPICIDGYYWLSHEPMYLNANMPYVNIHAHTHSQSFQFNQYFNSCVERNGFTPVNFRCVKSLYAEQACAESQD